MENEEPEKKFHGPVSDLINEVLLYTVSRCNCSGVRFFLNQHDNGSIFCNNNNEVQRKACSGFLVEKITRPHLNCN